MSTAVVILNWNGKHFLERFVPVLFERTGNASIFVADNGSTDGSVEWCETHFADGRGILIKFDRNYGFTGGYDRAFDEPKKNHNPFDYYLLLNSDVEVTDGWLDRLTNFMESHPDVAICSPKVLNYEYRDTFEHAGACGGMMDRLYFPWCRGRVLSTVEKDCGQYDNAAEVFWASGTSFMIRSEIWHQLGGLDESFFAHMEEIDLCWRAQLAGWRVWVVPSSVIYHVGGGTLPNDSPHKLYLNFRNNLLMMYKNLPERSRSRILFERRCVDIAIALIYLITGRFSFFRSVFRAHRDYHSMLPEIKTTPRVTELPRPVTSVFFKKIRNENHHRI